MRSRWSVVGAALVTALLAGCSASAASPSPAAPPASPASPDESSPLAATAVVDTSVDCSTLKCVALTYDDGPSKNTTKLTGTLKADQAPATFFMIGENVKKYPAQVQSAASDGFVIAVHSYDHASMKDLSKADQRAEVDKTSDALIAAGAPRPTLLRPPYGAYNPTTKTLGYPVINWDVDTRDWATHSSASTVEAVKKQVKPGSIILMHDTEASTVAATPAVIKYLRSQGYTLVTVPQLLGTAEPGHVYDARGLERH